MDYHQFPSEIWLQIVEELQQNDEIEDDNSGRHALCQLSLTNHYFQSIAQPALFSKFEMNASQHTPECYGARFKQRLDFASSPRFAGAVKTINVRYRSNVSTHYQFSYLSTPPSEGDLMKALSAHIEHFHSLTHIKLDSCCLSSTFFQRLFVVSQIKSLHIGHCVVEGQEFGSEMEAVPSFQLRELTIQTKPGTVGIPPVDEWWTQFLSPNTLEKLETKDMGVSSTFICHIATSGVPFASLRRFELLASFSDSLYFLKALGNLPSLESFSVPTCVVHSATDESAIQLDDIPPTIVPHLKHITADWRYTRAFLKYHPPLRNIQLPLDSAKWEELHGMFKTIKGIRPEITTLGLSSIEVSLTAAFRIALTELPSLETFTVNGFVFQSEIVDEVKGILLNEDLTPALRTINIGPREELLTKERNVSEELEEKLRNHPNMQIIYVFGNESELTWER